MAEIRIERKHGRNLWPWLVGLVVLALLMWAIAELVNTDRDNKTMAVADSAGAPGANAEAPVPSQPGAAAPASERAPEVGITPVGALIPLGVQHAGQTVSASGQVLTAPSHGGFWLRAEGNTVLWVRSPQPVKQGQSVQDLVATLQRPRPGEVDQWMKDSDLEAQLAKGAPSQITTEVYLDATSSKPATRPAASPTRSAAGGKPADARKR